MEYFSGKDAALAASNWGYGVSDLGGGNIYGGYPKMQNTPPTGPYVPRWRPPPGGKAGKGKSKGGKSADF